MAEIDFSEANWQIRVGDRSKRSLIRHFTSAITCVLAARGISSEVNQPKRGGEKISNPDEIERMAWYLADTFISRVADSIDEMIDVELDGRSAGETLESVSDEFLQDIEEEFLGEDSLDLAVLCDFAVGRFPQPILDID